MLFPLLRCLVHAVVVLPLHRRALVLPFLVQSHELRKAASAVMLEGARKLHSPSGPGAETMLCSSSLRFVPTSAFVVSLRVFVRISCAFKRVSLGVSLASKSTALAALLDSMAHLRSNGWAFDVCHAQLLDCFAQFLRRFCSFDCESRRVCFFIILLIEIFGHRPALIFVLWCQVPAVGDLLLAQLKAKMSFPFVLVHVLKLGV